MERGLNHFLCGSRARKSRARGLESRSHQSSDLLSGPRDRLRVPMKRKDTVRPGDCRHAPNGEQRHEEDNGEGHGVRELHGDGGSGSPGGNP